MFGLTRHQCREGTFTQKARSRCESTPSPWLATSAPASLWCWRTRSRGRFRGCAAPPRLLVHAAARRGAPARPPRAQRARAGRAVLGAVDASCSCVSSVAPLVLECLEAVEESAAPTRVSMYTLVGPSLVLSPNSIALARAGLFRAAPRLAAWRRQWSVDGAEALVECVAEVLAGGCEAKAWEKSSGASSRVSTDVPRVNIVDLETRLLTPARRGVLRASFTRLDCGSRDRYLHEAVRSRSNLLLEALRARSVDAAALLLRCGADPLAAPQPPVGSDDAGGATSTDSAADEPCARCAPRRRHCPPATRRLRPRAKRV